MPDKITINVSKEFLAWWKTLVYSNDEGLMWVAWGAWKACEEQIKKG